MKQAARSDRLGWWLFLIALALTTSIYWTGLSGGYLFDDYPNIVENHGVQPTDASIPSLVRAALSSPSSEFKRPLASISFAANYLATGLDPYWMKLTNLLIHLLNGTLIFLLTRLLMSTTAGAASATTRNRQSGATFIPSDVAPTTDESPAAATGQRRHAGVVAALISAAWMLLPINLTAVLYVVQRMESMANLFVLLGLIGYVAGRRRMLASTTFSGTPSAPRREGFSSKFPGFVFCLISITVPTALGVLAKETAVMLPLYALLVEWTLFRFKARSGKRDHRLFALFLFVLILPMLLGLAWLLPSILKPETWATRDFTLGTRLLSETRIVVDYLVWILLPTPHALSFYHDDFRVSSGLLTPWSTLASIAALVVLTTLMVWQHRRRPLVALGIGWFLGCQLLTGSILPLELIYEHRNYFSSFGLLLAIVPLLAAPAVADESNASRGRASAAHNAVREISSPAIEVASTEKPYGALPFAWPRFVLLGGLMLCWAVLTATTSYAWGNPLRLAEDLANRAPQSPRAQYELGRTYIVYSHYDPASPFTRLAYAPLELAASLPDASILPEQALIFMNARMHLPIKDEWWKSLIAKLKAHKPGVQDESSLGALTQCVREHHCDLPKNRMVAAFMAALSHPDPSARLLATYGDYAWNVLDDKTLGRQMAEEAVRAEPSEPEYHVTLIRMLVAQKQTGEARKQLRQLQLLNIGGRLDREILPLETLLDAQ